MSLTHTTTSVESPTQRCYAAYQKWEDENNWDELFWVENNPSSLLMNLGGNRFELMVPADFPKRKEGSLMLLPEGSADGGLFFEEINEWIMTKNPKLPKLLNQLKKKWTKYNRVRKKPSFQVPLEDSPTMDDISRLKGVDLEEMKMEDYLQKLAEKSTMEFKEDESLSSKSVKMFDEKCCANLVVREFMEAYRAFKNSSQVDLELIDENIFHWRLRFHHFKNPVLNAALRDLKGKHGYDYIEMSFKMHPRLFPSYPVVPTVLRPKLDNSLMHRIPAMRIFQFERWSPTRSLTVVIQKMQEVLENHAVVQLESDLNDMEKNPEGAFFELEAHLMKLATMFESSDDAFEPLDTEEYPIYQRAPTEVTKTTPAYAQTAKSGGWAKGTGYGSSSATDWDSKKYQQMQDEKNKQLTSLIENIYTLLLKHEGHMLPLYRTLKNSYLIPFLKRTLKGTSWMEMNRNSKVYLTLLEMITVFANEEGVFLFDDHTSQNLFQIMMEIAEKDSDLAHLDKDKDEGEGEDDDSQKIINTIKGILDMVSPSYAMYQSSKKAEKKVAETVKVVETPVKPVSTEVSLQREYVSKMKKHQFLVMEFKHHKYASDANFKPNRAFKKRLKEEIYNLRESSPIHYDSSVFIRLDQTRLPLIKAMITGPDGTPYDSGCLIFDAVVHSGWPAGPPKCNQILNQNYRFNPNLYKCGKVCLSLLGTWGNNWNPDVSTLHQLFTSIQSFILIPDPYFNEPGYENTRGTPSGDETSRKYTHQRRLYTMHASMYEMLKNPPPEFADAIRDHFRFKKKYVTDLMQKWVDEDDGTHRSKMVDYQKKILDLLKKL